MDRESQGSWKSREDGIRMTMKWIRPTLLLPELLLPELLLPKLLLQTLLLLAMMTLPAWSAAAEGSSKEGEYDWTGIYGKVGIAIGFPVPTQSGVDLGTAVGFDLSEGLRINRWLAVEGNLNWVGGADVDGTDENLAVFSGMFNGKWYPLGMFDVSVIPDSIQPYASGGIGGGQVKLKESGEREGSFIGRVGGGLDWHLSKKMGLYLDGGYLFISNSNDGEATGLDGNGQINIGVHFRM
jgi:opacity protein-like surface antigen